MAADLHQTWNDIASCFDDWGPPLRPSREDIEIMRRALAGWHREQPIERPVEKPRVFLCGVTPEIADMQWPFPIELIAIDQAESMVRLVWPGDIAGVRRAVVGDWLNSGLPPHSQDVIIGDGGFAFFDFPHAQRALVRALSKLLKPRGIFVYRHSSQIPQPESLPEVLDALHAGRIGNFHAFKWRLAMTLQRDSSSGVRQHDIWQACMDAGFDPEKLPQPGWSRRAVDTIRFYENKQARLYFPTLKEFKHLLADDFEDVKVEFPTYELGERCPIITARPRT